MPKYIAHTRLGLAPMMVVKSLPQRSQLGTALFSSDVANLNEFSDGDVMDGLSLRMPPQVSSLDTSNSPPSKNSINVLCDLPACRVTFNPSSIQQHLVQHHTNLERKDGKITCPIDGHRVTEANYGRHILNVHFKHLKGWCDICKKDLSRKDNLKRHMKTHMGQD
ncbi:hypothetical protein EDD18DRAFT_265523 [Armillaria luteobubalina]|uniref:C2H2-type domain-containing protein n=1 Tax=Armillaria luteobubalina TaxID=153913 RepID=A0AA39Q5D2_9AGAR|nr:hypothetical protein EDD18DRAFT_265523 [Armillaria luteobubalina]